MNGVLNCVCNASAVVSAVFWVLFRAQGFTLQSSRAAATWGAVVASTAELASAVHISTDELHDIRRQLYISMSSIEDCYSDSDPAFRSEDPDAEASLLQIEDRAGLADAIVALPDRLQLVIKLHFVEELNLTEIAAILDVSVPRVHQLKANALEKLRIGLTARESI